MRLPGQERRRNQTVREVGFILLWMIVDLIVLTELNEREWWFSFQIISLAVISNFYNVVIPKLLAAITGTAVYIPFKRTLVLNTGIFFSLFGLFGSFIPKTAEYATGKHEALPTISGWVANLYQLDIVSLACATLAIIGLILVAVAMGWLLWEIKEAKLEKPFRMPGLVHALSIGVGSHMLVTSLSAFDGFSALFGATIRTSRSEVFLLAFACLILPTLVAALHFAPALMLGTSQPKFEQIADKWTTLTGLAIAFFAITRLSYSIADPNDLTETTVLSFLFVPTVLVAITITRLAFPVLTSIRLKRPQLAGWLMWTGIANYVVGTWLWVVATFYQIVDGDFYIYSLFTVGVKVIIAAYVVNLIETVRKAGRWRSPLIVPIQTFIYVFLVTVTFMGVHHIIILSRLSISLLSLAISIVIFLPAFLGYPKRAPGDPTSREEANTILNLGLADEEQQIIVFRPLHLRKRNKRLRNEL